MGAGVGLGLRTWEGGVCRTGDLGSSSPSLSAGLGEGGGPKEQGPCGKCPSTLGE